MSNRFNQVETLFGEKWYEAPFQYALRFELAQGTFWTNRLGTAVHRAMTIIDSALEEAEDLHLGIVRYFDNEQAYGRAMKVLSESIDIYGLPSIKEFTSRIYLHDEEIEASAWAGVSPLKREHVGRAVWAAISCDFGSLLPASPGRVYIISCSRGLLCHPYDDRGMDVRGLSREALQGLYLKHNDWLLDYDRAKMDSIFGL
ncbi:MAG: DUF3885 domain-containing protein [Phycisphaerales bacterium]